MQLIVHQMRPQKGKRTQKYERKAAPVLQTPGPNLQRKWHPTRKRQRKERKSRLSLIMELSRKLRNPTQKAAKAKKKNESIENEEQQPQMAATEAAAEWEAEQVEVDQMRPKRARRRPTPEPNQFPKSAPARFECKQRKARSNTGAAHGGAVSTRIGGMPVRTVRAELACLPPSAARSRALLLKDPSSTESWFYLT